MSEKLAYGEAEQILDQLIKFGTKLGLDNIHELMQVLGQPHRHQRFVHVAGTNGKGSVCAFVEAALRAAGWRTGLFTSPHLVSVRERIRVDGKPISEATFAALVSQIRHQAASLLASESRAPTYFEMTTAMALLQFKQAETDVGVIEVGLGGRLDSTNVITPAVSVITHIDLDHLGVLGNTLAAIAGEKGGIIKHRVPVVIGERKPETVERLLAIADEREAPVYRIGDQFDLLGYDLQNRDGRWCQVNRLRWHDEERTIVTDLVGRHQATNCAVSYATLQVLRETGHRFDIEAAVDGLAHAVWPGRLQWLEPGLLIDSAHNPSGMTETVASIQELAPAQRFHVLLAVLNDKAWREAIDILLPITDSLRLIRINQPRTEDPQVIERYIRERYPDLPVKVCSSVDAAVDQLRETGNGLIIGSIYFAGEVFNYLWPGQAVELG